MAASQATTSRSKRLVLALLAGGIGFLINLFPIEIFPGIHLIFGAAASLIIASLFGQWPGGLAGLIAGSRTWALWHQPFPASMLLYGLEGLFVGHLKTRFPRLRPLFAILIYWIALGGWLNLAAQYLLFKLPFETSLFIQIRSIVNGLICGLIVEAGLLVISLARRQQRQELKPVSMATVISLFLTIAISLPILYSSTSYARQVRERLLAKTNEVNAQQINSTNSEVTALVESYQRALELTAAIIEREKSPDGERLQQLLKLTRERYPVFAGLYIADINATTIAFEPIYNEHGQYLIGLNYSDRQYYKEMLNDGRTNFSNVYQGRGGLPLPVVSIGVPLRDSESKMTGFVLGWFDLRSFQALVKRHTLGTGAQLVITDKIGQLIADSALGAEEQSVVRNYADSREFKLVSRNAAGTAELVKTANDDQPTIAAAKAFNRYWLTYSTLNPTGWKVFINQSSEPIDRQIAGLYLKTIITVFLLILLAAAFAQLVSMIIIGPLRQLQLSAEQLAAGDFSSRPRIKTVMTIELASLVNSFTRMATALEEAFIKQRGLYEELSRRESELENLIASAYDAICALSKDGNIVWLNQRAAELTRMELEQLKGAQFIELIFTADRAIAEDQLAAAMAGTPNTVEYRFQDLEGDLKDLLVTASPIITGSEISGVLLIARDITDEKHSKERALQADKLRAMGQLATGVAHNFNNALAAIIGRAQLMKLKTAEPYIVSGLAVIERAALDSANMVKRIQTFSKRKREDQFAIEDLSLLLQDAVELTRTRWQDDARANRLEYNVEVLTLTSAYVNAVASELREVFVNLIINALDAMPAGGDLMISLTTIDEQAQIILSDTGSGMSEEVKARIFEPFFTTKGMSGTGLGLSVSYGIIARHSGIITVDSTPGKGTSFIIRLPLARPIATSTSEREIAEQVRELKILVIDDEEIVRETLVEYLEFGGHQAIAVADDEDWIAKLQGGSFDIVITDLSMPKVDGYHVAMLVRQGWPQMRIMLATGYGDGIDQTLLDDGTIDGVLSKPFNLEQINSSLNRVMSK